jgi:hypothetical protein
MAQSPEYPDLRWIPPRSWTDANRKSVQLLVIHTTEGSAHAKSAEDGAIYNQTRRDGTSAHFFHDSDSTVQGVRTADIAHCAKGEGNRRGIHYEICDRTGQNAGQWADAYSMAAIRQCAKQAARDAKKWGIPVRHLTVAQVRAGAKGFCAHWDISRAFGQSDHTDPGPNFPWTLFLNMVRAELAPPPPAPPKSATPEKEEEDDMQLSDQLWDPKKPPAFAAEWIKDHPGANPTLFNLLFHSATTVDRVEAELEQLKGEVAALTELLTPAESGDEAEETTLERIARGGFNPAQDPGQA